MEMKAVVLAAGVFRIRHTTKNIIIDTATGLHGAIWAVAENFLQGKSAIVIIVNIIVEMIAFPTSGAR